MGDLGHTQTERLLDGLEERLGDIYTQAYEDVKKKADDYFARFAVKDKAKRDLVAAGKISKDEYYTWRRNQMLSGKRWTDLRDQLAQDLTNVNKIAAGMVRGELNEVFAINANYSEYMIENGMRMNYGFTLYDRNTVANLVMNDPDIIPWKPDVDVPADLRWNRQMVTSHITQGILQGESIPHLSKRLLKTVNNDKIAAVRTARTAVTSAQNAGRQAVYDKAKSMGLNLQKEWLATLDGRTRHDHGMADGQRVPLDGKFTVGGYKMKYPGDMSAPGWLVYNCRCATITVEPEHITKGEEPRKTYSEWIEEKKKGKDKKPQTTPFIPAKTTEEAQQYADRFVSTYKSSLTGQVDYGGIQLSYANEMNRAFTEVFDAYDTPHPLRNIKPFNTREKRFKGTTAEAAYQWGINDMFYNKAYYKTVRAFNDHLDGYNKLLQTVLPNIDTAIARTKPGASLRYLEALKRTGRTNVFAPDAYGSTIHEMGHYLDDQIFRKAFKEKGFDLSASFEKYSGGISGYATATQQEYIAESFAAYWKGETDILDTNLVDIFKGLRKK